MEAIIIIAIVLSIVSSLTKVQQRRGAQGSARPRVREAAPARQAPDEQARETAAPARHQAPHIPIRDIEDTQAKQDVARDSSGTITTTDRVAMVSRLKDTAVEREVLESKKQDGQPSDASEQTEDERAQEALRREVLHGIIMSEILTRPAQRKPVWRRT